MIGSSGDDGPIRVGLVGCGFIAGHHAAAYRADARARLVAVCDAVPERARAFAAAWGARAVPDLDALLDTGVDLVDICTPPADHAAAARRAIAAGRHVFVEKPLALDVAEAEALVAAARTRGVRLATNFNRRYGSGYLQARTWQLDGRLGDFAWFSAAITAGPPDPPPPGAPPFEPYHAAHDLLIHLADLARHFGGPIRRVSAHMSRRAGPALYRNLAVALEFAGGGAGTLLVSLEGTRLHPIERAEIGGTAGHAVVHNCVGGCDLYPHDSEVALTWRPQPFGGRHHLLQFYPTTIAAHVEALLTALLTDADPPVTGEDGAAALQLIQAAIRSHETGQAVEVG